MDSRLLTMIRQAYPDVYKKAQECADKRGSTMTSFVGDCVLEGITKHDTELKDFWLALYKKIREAKKAHVMEIEAIYTSGGFTPHTEEELARMIDEDELWAFNFTI